ncbi:MAG: hypothetical protein P4M08_07875 [Oligoflexia bacterium]|nr:hypothetical protein [Oligoflexia bacterium]
MLLAWFVSLFLPGSGAFADILSTYGSPNWIPTWDSHHEAAHQASLGADLKYYNTSSNYDSSGHPFTPPNLDHADRIDAQFTGALGLTDRLSLFAVLDLRRAGVATPSTSAQNGGTSYGLGDQSIGANFRVYEKELVSIDFQFQLDFPAYVNSDPNADPELGDATENLSAGIFGTIPVFQDGEREISARAGIGYTYRTAGFSADIPWLLQIRSEPKARGLLASVGLTGIQSLNTDSNSNSPQTVAGLGTQGSFITNAVNPTLITAGAQIGYRTAKDIDFTIGGSQSIYGENAPKGYTLGAGAAFHFGKEAASPPESPTPPPQTSLNATVSAFNDSFHLAKIDRGSDDGVKVGDIFDIIGKDGPIARCQITDLKSHEAVLKIQKYYKEAYIEKGDTARREN